MQSRVAHNGYGHAFFVTFSCYKRRRLLDIDLPKQLVLDILNSQLEKQNGKCQGFVIMPNHIHAMVWFPEQDQLNYFLRLWKQRSSRKIKKNLRDHRSRYLHMMDNNDPIWQSGYYSFNIHSSQKMREKLNYMHANPVRAGLVANAEDWRFSSARYYYSGIYVGVPIEQPG